MKISELKSLSILSDKNINDFEISRLCLDSRKCEENSIFFAIKGTQLNGEDYIDSAIEKGAKAIIIDESSNFPISEKKYDNITFIKTPDIQQTLADICEEFYQNIPTNIVAVTGTNGKTSTACFFAMILKNLGYKSASLGTIGALIDGDFTQNIDESGLTTPDIITLYETLTELQKRNIEYICLEASSHGLEQNRLGNIKFSATAFLNLSQDHLDYHDTMENYLAAKALLFSNHSKQNIEAILNCDIAEYSQLQNICTENNLDIKTYGNNSTDLRIDNITPTNQGLEITINNNIIKTALIGEFQAYNLTCAIGLVNSLNIAAIEEIFNACNGIKSVRGRMEIYEIPQQNAKAVIDYAHTPDALEKAITSLKPHTSRRIITIFGCGGDRDKTKRPIMGKVAHDYSDIAIVTDDNPRNEDAAIIRKETIAECPDAIEIGDRKQAILKGLNMLQSGDSLLIAGKGHEDYQIIGNKKIHFDDLEVIKEYLKD